jgi:hypothetical protein
MVNYIGKKIHRASQQVFNPDSGSRPVLLDLRSLPTSFEIRKGLYPLNFELEHNIGPTTIKPSAGKVPRSPESRLELANQASRHTPAPD